MRWGMPLPAKFGRLPVPNIRNTFSPPWRGWLKPDSRCLVPGGFGGLSDVGRDTIEHTGEAILDGLQKDAGATIAFEAPPPPDWAAQRKVLGLAVTR